MPIFRYFLFVVAAASYDQPLIRIRSDRHLPERVVLDTSQPTIAAPVMKTAAAVPQPTAQADPLADASAKARVRETFAQFTPKADGKPQAQVQAPVQPKRKVARAHSAPRRGQPMMQVAQQPHFGLFDTTW